MKSEKTILKHGISLGSVLSSLLILLYIADMHCGTGNLHVILFADYVVIWAQDSKLHMAETRLQQALNAGTT